MYLQRLQDAAYSLHNKLQGAEISSMPMAATVAQPGQAAAAPTAAAGTQAGVAQALTPQWTIDPSLQQPSAASSAASQQSASSGSSAQPMSASVATPSVLAPAADSVQGANVISAQPMAASEASAAPAHIAGTNPSGALQMPGAANQVPLPSSMQTGTAANAVADGMQRAVANAQNMRNARAARSANPQAISATAMAASEQTAAAAPAAPAVSDALAMGATVPQQQQAQPAIASSASMAAPQQQLAQPNQHQASSSANKGEPAKPCAMTYNAHQYASARHFEPQLWPNEESFFLSDGDDGRLCQNSSAAFHIWTNLACYHIQLLLEERPLMMQASRKLDRAALSPWALRSAQPSP